MGALFLARALEGGPEGVTELAAASAERGRPQPPEGEAAAWSMPRRRSARGECSTGDGGLTDADQARGHRPAPPAPPQPGAHRPRAAGLAGRRGPARGAPPTAR